MRVSSLLLICFLGFSFLAKAQAPISISLKVKTSLQSETFPVLAANKKWDSQTSLIMDMTSNSNYGKTLSAGVQPGWAVFLQANGAWAWNMGNGKARIDYMPTEKQRINDGKWHEIRMVFQPKSESVWLYFDGKEVVIMNYGSTLLEAASLQNNLYNTGQKEIKVKGLKISETWKRDQTTPMTKNELKVVSWNIWHGGRRNGIVEGIEQTVATLKAQEADILLLQETYGSGPILADSLDMTLYLISSNLSILTSLPFMEVFSPWDDFRLGGAVIQTGDDAYITAFDVWLNYLPDTDKMVKEEADYDVFVSEEIKVRGREALDMFKGIKSLGLVPLPTIIGGDMNSGSHLDWTLSNSGNYGGYFLAWPVSKTMYREGFIDTFRSVYPNSGKDLGYTWSPRFKDQLQYRIDYLYHDQANWKTVAAGVEGYEDTNWSSDHALVWAVLQRIRSVSP